MSANTEKPSTGLKLPIATTRRTDIIKHHVSFIGAGERRDSASFKSKIPKCISIPIGEIDKKLTDNSSIHDLIKSESTTPRTIVESTLPEYVEVPDFKALPFKKKAGFFVK